MVAEGYGMFAWCDGGLRVYGGGRGVQHGGHGVKGIASLVYKERVGCGSSYHCSHRLGVRQGGGRCVGIVKAGGRDKAKTAPKGRDSLVHKM
jgi:hypothetical protein